jgi:hypothetical protein
MKPSLVHEDDDDTRSFRYLPAGTKVVLVTPHLHAGGAGRNPWKWGTQTSSLLGRLSDALRVRACDRVQLLLPPGRYSPMHEALISASLSQAIYASSAKQLFQEAELVELLRKARDRNAASGVSGMLLYKDGNFIQVLEGKPDVLAELIGRIARDPRHGGMLVLSHIPIEQREFGEWSMGFVNADKIDDAAFSPFLRRAGDTWSGTEMRRGKRMLQSFKTNMR